MRKIVLISVAAALLAPTVPAQAVPATQTSAQPTAAAEPRDRDAALNPDREICVSERLSGSRMPRRVCRTARQWQELHGDDAQER